MSIHGKNFELPQMTDHDAMEDVALEDEEINGSANMEEQGVDGMGFEEFNDEENYVAPENVSQETVEELKQKQITSKVGRAIFRLESILH